MDGVSGSYYGTTDDARNQSIITTASNIIDGTNPAYVLADFYASFPAFAPRTANGTVIATATMTDGGTGYAVGDILTVAGGTGGIIRVDSIDTNGVILTYELITGGTGYSATIDAATTVIPAGGSGATFTIVVNTTSTYLVDPLVIQMYIDFATACVKQNRYHSHWKLCMGWFVAHFVTMYLQSVTDANSTSAQVIAASKAKGLVTSKSVGDVSAGYDYSSIGNDLDGWAQWKLTVYGQQFASTGKLMGRAGMYVW